MARGFTLWELLLALAVGGMLVGLAVPAFQEFLLDARRTADVNAFVLAVQVARSEAAKRGQTAVLCKTADWHRCGGAELRFDAGFMVFVNTDDERPPHRSPPSRCSTHTGQRWPARSRPIASSSSSGRDCAAA